MTDYGVCSFSDPPFQAKMGINSFSQLQTLCWQHCSSLWHPESEIKFSYTSTLLCPHEHNDAERWATQMDCYRRKDNCSIQSFQFKTGVTMDPLIKPLRGKNPLSFPPTKPRHYLTTDRIFTRSQSTILVFIKALTSLSSVLLIYIQCNSGSALLIKDFLYMQIHRITNTSVHPQQTVLVTCWEVVTFLLSSPAILFQYFLQVLDSVPAFLFFLHCHYRRL